MADVVDVLSLLNQLMARFKDALAPVMQVGAPFGLIGNKDGWLRAAQETCSSQHVVPASCSQRRSACSCTSSTL